MPTFGKTAVRNKLHLLKESIFSDEQEQIVIGYQIFNAVKLDNSGYITYGDFNDTTTNLVGNSVNVNAWGDISITTNANRITDGKGNIEISAPTKSRLNSGVNEYNKISIGLKDANGTDFTKYIKFMINVTSGKSGVFIGSDNDIYLNADGKIINSADTELKKKLTVTGATALKSTLSVDGATTLNDKLTITKNGADVTGASTFKTSLVVGIKDQDANNFHFKVYGKTLLYGHTDIDTGGLNVTGEVDITSGNLVVHENIKVTKSITISGTGIGTGYALDVSGKSYFGDCINVYGANDSYFEKGITTHGNIDASYSGTKTTVYNFEAKGTTTLNGKLTLKGGLEVTGDSKFNDNVTIGNNTNDSTRRTLTVYGNIIGDRNLEANALTIGSSATINGTLNACKNGNNYVFTVNNNTNNGVGVTINGNLKAGANSSGNGTLNVDGTDVKINGNETISGGSLSITSSGLYVRYGITAYDNILFPNNYTSTHKIKFGDTSLNTFIEGDSSGGRISLSANDGIYLNTGSSIYLGTYDGTNRPIYYINADGSVKFSTISATTITASSATLSSLSIGGSLTVGGLTTLNSDLYFNRDKLSDLRKIRLVYSGTKDYAYISANKKYDDERSTYLNLYSTGYIIVDSFVFKVNNETSLNTVSIAGATTLSSTLTVSGGSTFKDSISILNDKYIKWIDLSNNQSAYIYTTCDGTDGKLKIGVSTSGLNSGIYFDDTIYFSNGDYYINTGGSAILSTISGGSISGTSLNIRNSTDKYLSVNSSGSSFYKDVIIGTSNSNASLTVNGKLTVTNDITLSLDKSILWGSDGTTGIQVDSNKDMFLRTNTIFSKSTIFLGLPTTTTNSDGTTTIKYPTDFIASGTSYLTILRSHSLVTNYITVDKTLTVTEKTTLKSDLDVTGNTTLKSALNVTGVTNLNSNLTVSGSTIIRKLNYINMNDNVNLGIAYGKKYYYINDNNTGTIGDSLIIGDVRESTTSSGNKVNANDGFVVIGSFCMIPFGLRVYDTTSLKSTLTVSGAATLGSTLDVTGKTTLSTLEVTGKTTIKSVLNVTGSATITGGITIPTNGGRFYAYGTGNTMKDLTVNENAEIKGTLTVNGTTTLNDKLTISKNGMAVTGESTFNNTVILSDNGLKITGSCLGVAYGKKFRYSDGSNNVYSNTGLVIGDIRESGSDTSLSVAHSGYVIIGTVCEMTTNLYARGNIYVDKITRTKEMQTEFIGMKYNTNYTGIYASIKVLQQESNNLDTTYINLYAANGVNIEDGGLSLSVSSYGSSLPSNVRTGTLFLQII